MLIEFRFRNYRCFRDEQVLSMVASSDDSLPDNVLVPIEGGKLRLLRSVVIYGSNASGKTTVLEALHFAQRQVIISARREPDASIDADPYLFDKDSVSGPSQFEFTFIQERVRYQYGFSVDRERVHSEYLYAAPRGVTVSLFQRNWNNETRQDDYAFGASLKGPNKTIVEVTRPNALFLSAAGTFKHAMLAAPYGWFANKLNGIQAHLAPLFRKAWMIDPKHHRGTQDLLQFADLGIEDFRVKEIAPDTENEGAAVGDERESDGQQRKRQSVVVEMLHPSSEKEAVAIRLERESNGTLHIFALSGSLLQALADGQAYYVDELDASMHPLLVRKIVELFQSPVTNRCNAQLIFNTHDTTLLDNSLFRRDQVWFIEKDSSAASHLYPLLEFSPRKGEALAKGYLQGRYGAIPFLGDVSSLFDKADCS